MTGTNQEPRNLTIVKPCAEDALVRRVRGEYREMPGLSLTVLQAARLWGLDSRTCAALLTTLTTMSGFGFLAISRYRGLAGLGWLAMTAIALAFAAAICVLPALLAAVAPRRTPHAEAA